MSAIEIQLPSFVQRDMAAAASDQGISQEMFMIIAIAEKAAQFRTVKKMSEPEMVKARERWLELLEKVPAGKPMKGDEMPAKLRKQMEKKFPVLKRLAKK
jgi:hypothetical protein